jgi:chemotaxis protein MotB
MSRKPVMTRRIRRHEEHTNHEAWAIPYGDLVTLLLAFFVVMYAISSVNAGKYRVLSDSLFAAFRGSPRTMDPIQVGQTQTGSGSELESTVIQSALSGQQRSAIAPVPVQGGNQPSGVSPIANHAAPGAAHAAAAALLSKVADDVANAMDDLVKQNMVVVRRSEFWIEVEIKTDILFPSGSAQLAPNAVDVIQRLGGALAPFPNSIRVEGHTDNKPIKTVAFMSNWELSAARAGSVVRVLQSRGVGPDRLAVIGYGEQRPVQANDTEQGRNANRRVVVVILSTELQRQKAGDDQAPASAPSPQAPAADTTAAAPPSAATTASAPGATPLSSPTTASTSATALPAAPSAAAPPSAATTASAPGATPLSSPTTASTSATALPAAPSAAATTANMTPVTPGVPADLPTAHPAPPPPATTRVQLVSPP